MTLPACPIQPRYPDQHTARVAAMRLAKRGSYADARPCRCGGWHVTQAPEQAVVARTQREMERFISQPCDPSADPDWLEAVLDAPGPAGDLSDVIIAAPCEDATYRRLERRYGEIPAWDYLARLAGEELDRRAVVTPAMEEGR